MTRRLGKNLIVPKAQTVYTKQFGASFGDGLVINQLAQGVIYAEATKEVAHDLAGSIGKGLLHFVEALSVLIEIGNDVGDGITKFADFVGRQNIDGANKPISIKAFAQRVHGNESSNLDIWGTSAARTTNAKRARP